MFIDVIETNTVPALLAFIEEANQEQTAAWGMARLKKAHLKDIGNDQLVLMLKPALSDAAKAKIFFPDSKTVYVAWSGMLGQTYKKLSSITEKELLKPGSKFIPEQAVTYFDPRVNGNELEVLVKSEIPAAAEPIAPAPGSENHLEANAAQIAHFRKIAAQRNERPKLQILMVEDQLFLRKLSQEILQESYEVDARSSAEEGWQSYLETAPDIAFLDIGLPGASGHALAQKIKEIDPNSYIIMLTASRDLEDVEQARHNRVDGFVTKPFSRQSISERIAHFRAIRKKT